jgi:hypothetical protein
VTGRSHDIDRSFLGGVCQMKERNSLPC